MSTPDADDRREYYRIEDTIALEFHPLSGAEAQARDELHDPSPLFNLLGELHLLDYESQHLQRQISGRDRTLADYLKTINRRIDLLGQAMAHALLREIGEPRPVSLSEGGLRFVDSQPLAIGSHLALKIVLLPHCAGLLLRAQVNHCQALDGGRHEIGVVFTSLSDSQRQLLARHILQRQAQERRLAREQSAD